MKGRHKTGDSVLLHAVVTGVDEGGLVPIYDKNADGTDNEAVIIGYTGDTFVHMQVADKSLSLKGSQVSDPIEPITQGEPVGNDTSSESTQPAAEIEQSSASGASTTSNGTTTTGSSTTPASASTEGNEESIAALSTSEAPASGAEVKESATVE